MRLTDSNYIELREKAQREAYMYGKIIYPRSITVILKARGILDRFRDLDSADDLLDILPNCIQECKDVRDSTRTLLEEQERVAVRFSRLTGTLGFGEKAMSRKIEESRERMSNNINWGIGGCLV